MVFYNQFLIPTVGVQQNFYSSHLLCKRHDLTMLMVPIKHSQSVFIPQIECQRRGFCPLVCISLFHILFRTWWSSWMLTAPSALSCCSSPPGASSQPVWHLTSTPCPESFPVCTSWHWMPHSIAGEWSCFLVLMCIIPPLCESPVSMKGFVVSNTFCGLWLR